ncbi:type II toxin-antitoxin system VapC family toxin [Sphingosinicellaceae bacterium]|nr:type II toxin-antitoxin system VapC family toxin [Sphingosinicellaceae bacterium]
MVVDTSALIAMLQREDGHAAIGEALAAEKFILPAPALVEFWRVARRGNRMPVALIDDFLAVILSTGSVAPFLEDHARAASIAAEHYGSGNGKGGPLNLLDLMVYGVAKVTRLPILFTGMDFPSTDAALHPASRVG